MKTLREVAQEGIERVGAEKTEEIMDYIIMNRPVIYEMNTITKFNKFANYVHQELDGFINLYLKEGGKSD